MNKKKGEAFVKLPLALLSSKSWQALSINAHRFVCYLMIEHMRHGGRRNGFLVAPRKQLHDFGISDHFVSVAIEDTERLGLVDCRRGVGRRPNLYSLTWLPLSGDGTEGSNRWRECDSAAEALISARKLAKQRKSNKTRSVVSGKQHPLRMTAVCTGNDCQPAVTRPVATAKQQSQQGVPNSSTLLESSYQDGVECMPVDGVADSVPLDETPTLAGEDGVASSGATCRWYVTDATGYRICRKPVVPGCQACQEHSRNAAQNRA